MPRLSQTAKIRQLHFTNQAILKIYTLIHRLYRFISNIGTGSRYLTRIGMLQITILLISHEMNVVKSICHMVTLFNLPI
ncbi:hypothetical protein SAMN05216327_107314 [Dyadobacter sp. SG02]|nr:hypothetical protein SAMN05216327_107314 [Dyadobacter sp. SG02]